MTSQLNVDTIVDKQGTGGSNVKMANTSTYVSDGGAVSQNTVQGLAKSWVDVEGSTGTPSINDSINVASLTDGGTGDTEVNMSNSTASTNVATAGLGQSHTRNFVTGAGATPTTSKYSLFAYRESSGSADSDVAGVLFGDLA
jgi:hypothetical protein